MSDPYMMAMEALGIDTARVTLDDAPELASYAEIADTLRAGVGDEGYGGDDD